ncbi:MAG: fluoride efflux transporter CrcB [Alistipes sp.]
MIRELLTVGIGGAVGSMARYLLSYKILTEYMLWGFHTGTFVVNVAGSLLIGLVLGAASDSMWFTRLVVIGFCGGFTTFSTFSVDALRLLRDGEYATAGLYMGLSVVVCVVCAALGMWIGEILKN